MREEYVSKKGLSTFSGHFFGFQRRQARDTGGNGPRLKIYDPNMVTSSFDCVRKTEKVRQITFLRLEAGQEERSFSLISASLADKEDCWR